jgi:hypothetical protein
MNIHVFHHDNKQDLILKKLTVLTELVVDALKKDKQDIVQATSDLKSSSDELKTTVSSNIS